MSKNELEQPSLNRSFQPLEVGMVEGLKYVL